MNLLSAGWPAARYTQKIRRLPSMEQHYGKWLCRGENVSVHYAHLPPDSWPEHSHRQAELLLTFDDAQAKITWWDGAGQREAAVGAHQFCLIPPDFPHACEWSTEADAVVVYLDEEFLHEHVREPLGGVIVGDFQPLSRLDACLWSLGAIFKDLCGKEDFPPASFIEGVGVALAARTLEQHFQKNGRSEEARQKLAPDGTRRVIDYIEGHLQENITMEDLAKHVCLSEDHFRELFKNTTGLPPLQFVLKHRVQKALELLRTGKFRVAEAAYEVGFSDQSHFDRHCRKFFGFSPKQGIKNPESSSKNPETSKIPTLEMI